jgi:hypothetical protein
MPPAVRSARWSTARRPGARARSPWSTAATRHRLRRRPHSAIALRTRWRRAIAEAALRLDPSLRPTDAALFARDAFLATAPDLRAALASARHGAELIAAGFAADIDYCARLDASTTVPLLHRDEKGLPALRAL